MEVLPITFRQNDRDFVLEISVESTIADLKDKVSAMVDIIPESFNLYCDGNVLDEDLVVADSCLTLDSVVEIVDEQDRATVLFKFLKNRDPEFDCDRFNPLKVARKLRDLICDKLECKELEESPFFKVYVEIFGLIGSNLHHFSENILFDTIFNENRYAFSLVLKYFKFSRFSNTVGIYGYFDEVGVFAFAVKQGDPFFVSGLLELDPEGNLFDYNTAFCVVANENNNDIAELFIDRVTNFGINLLIVEKKVANRHLCVHEYIDSMLAVVRHRNLELFRMILNRGCDIRSVLIRLKELELNLNFIREIIISGHLLEFIEIFTDLDQISVNRLIRDSLEKIEQRTRTIT